MALGRTKIGRRQRAEPPRGQQETVGPDRELESYLAALSPEDDKETTGSGRGFGAAQVYQLRLPLMANERLKELAAQQGTSPDALARDWVMQHLADADASVPAWPEGDAREPSPVPRHQDRPHPDDAYAPQHFPDDQRFPEDQPFPEAEHPARRHPGGAPQQYSGQLYPGDATPYGQQPDPYHVDETDTEITIPGNQYRYY